jgi:hypothetical protein
VSGVLTNHNRVFGHYEIRIKHVLGGLNHEYWLEEMAGLAQENLHDFILPDG